MNENDLYGMVLEDTINGKLKWIQSTHDMYFAELEGGKTILLKVSNKGLNFRLESNDNPEGFLLKDLYSDSTLFQAIQTNMSSSITTKKTEFIDNYVAWRSK